MFAIAQCFIPTVNLPRKVAWHRCRRSILRIGKGWPRFESNNLPPALGLSHSCIFRVPIFMDALASTCNFLGQQKCLCIPCCSRRAISRCGAYQIHKVYQSPRPRPLIAKFTRELMSRKALAAGFRTYRRPTPCRSPIMGQSLGQPHTSR